MKIQTVCSLSIIATGLAQAAQFKFQSSFDPPDVLIGIRQTGGASQIVADLGPVTRFTSAEAGSSFLVTEVPAQELLKVFPVLDGVGIAVFAAVWSSEGLPGNAPESTLWVTNPRIDLGTQTTPYVRKAKTVQAVTAGRIATIGDNAATSSGNLPDGPENDGNLVVLATDDPNQYSAIMGEQGNFGVTFSGAPELIVPADFQTSGMPVRTDFYQLSPLTSPPPKDKNGTYLGYFELSPDGTLRFQAPGGAPPPAPAPSIVGVQRDGSVSTVTFTTVAGNYRYSLLRAPDSNPMAPLAQWTTQGQSVPGTGNPVSLTDTTDSQAAFYRVTVSP